jgi:hypothetical protein
MSLIERIHSLRPSPARPVTSDRQSACERATTILTIQAVKELTRPSQPVQTPGLLPPTHLLTLPRPMKAKQRHDLATNALARELESLPDKLKRWANTILTVVLIAAAVAMLVRWRINSTEQARQEILNQLATAQLDVTQLGSDMSNYPPQFLAQRRTAIVSQVRDSVTAVLNNSDDPKFKAMALIARGDLYWQLANFPPLPGAATQPFLRPEESVDQYLAQAADSYQQVLSGDTYKQQHDAIVSARFGLAAIDQNRHDWASARNHLQLIAEDADAPAPLKDLANRQISTLPLLQTSLYISPATQPTMGPMVFAPTTAPTTQPMH